MTTPNQRRLDVDVNPQASRIVTHAELANGPTEHARCATLRFAVGTTQGMNVHVNVFAGDIAKHNPIILGSTCGKSEDEARRAVPNLPVDLFAHAAFAHRVGVGKELAPATLDRADEAFSTLEQRGGFRLREGGT